MIFDPFRWCSGKQSACRGRRCWFNPGVGKIPWRWKWQPTPVFLPGKSHGQRSLAGYWPWGHKEPDTTKYEHARVGYQFDTCSLEKLLPDLSAWFWEAGCIDPVSGCLCREVGILNSHLHGTGFEWRSLGGTHQLWALATKSWFLMHQGCLTEGSKTRVGQGPGANPKPRWSRPGPYLPLSQEETVPHLSLLLSPAFVLKGGWRGRQGQLGSSQAL